MNFSPSKAIILWRHWSPPLLKNVGLPKLFLLNVILYFTKKKKKTKDRVHFLLRKLPFPEIPDATDDEVLNGCCSSSTTPDASRCEMSAQQSHPKLLAPPHHHRQAGPLKLLARQRGKSFQFYYPRWVILFFCRCGSNRFGGGELYAAVGAVETRWKWNEGKVFFSRLQ